MKKILFAILLSIPLNLFCQELGTFSRVEAGINAIGISTEIPINEKISIEPFFGVGTGYNMNGEKDGPTQKMDLRWALLQPSVHASAYGKFFYNRPKRKDNGKSLLLNSGNFIGVKVKYVSKTLSDPQHCANTILANVNWGGQFNIGKHWMYSYSIALGYGRNLDRPYGLFYPAFDLKVAYVLPLLSKKHKY